MLKKWLLRINLLIAASSIAIFLLACLFFILQPRQVVIPQLVETKPTLPKNSFEMKKERYDAIGERALELKFVPLSKQLPDLRNHLVYYGKNGRPDANKERTVLHFAFVGNTTVSSLIPGEKLYLSYDRTKTPHQYLFSPENVPTPIWIEATAEGNEAIVSVHMKNEQGEVLTEPKAYALFKLSEKDGLSRNASRNWELGKLRVDGSLLARQKASWKGLDLFLEKHGGEEFKSFKGKHRIEFSHDEEQGPYSIYVGLNDSVIWNGTRWKVVEPGENSLNYPLMVVKKIDDRVMGLELWDVDGKARVPLNLVRLHELSSSQSAHSSFECLGARTRSQYICELDKQRMLLSPQDWLLKTEEGWIKLTTLKQIDDYVDRKSVGWLFILEGVDQNDGRPVLRGTLFNPSRTEMQEIEIPIEKVSSPTPTAQKPVAIVDEEDDESDFDEEEEDEESVEDEE